MKNPDTDHANSQDSFHRTRKARKQYVPRLKPLPKEMREQTRLYAVEQTPRGDAILVFLDLMRYLENRQVADLCFVGFPALPGLPPRKVTRGREAANISLRRLFNQGLINRVQTCKRSPRTGMIYNNAVNVLSEKGARYVQEIYDREDRGQRTRPVISPRELATNMIDHHLYALNICIRVMRLVDKLPEGEVLEFYDDTYVRSMTRGTATSFGTGFVPDAFLLTKVQTATGGFRYCPVFIENDAGEEVVMSKVGSTKDWYTKIVKYGELFSSDLWRHEPVTVDAMEAHGLTFDQLAKPVVLTVTTSNARRKNMLEATRNAGGATTYYYALREDLFPEEPFGRSGPQYLEQRNEWEGRNRVAASLPIWAVVDEPPRCLPVHLAGALK